MFRMTVDGRVRHPQPRHRPRPAAWKATLRVGDTVQIDGTLEASTSIEVFRKSIDEAQRRREHR